MLHRRTFPRKALPKAAPPSSQHPPPPPPLPPSQLPARKAVWQPHKSPRSSAGAAAFGFHPTAAPRHRTERIMHTEPRSRRLAALPAALPAAICLQRGPSAGGWWDGGFCSTGGAGSLQISLPPAQERSHKKAGDSHSQSRKMQWWIQKSAPRSPTLSPDGLWGFKGRFAAWTPLSRSRTHLGTRPQALPNPAHPPKTQ